MSFFAWLRSLRARTWVLLAVAVVLAWPRSSRETATESVIREMFNDPRNP